MTGDNKRENIDLELRQAEEVERAATVLIREGLFKDAISRVYFYALHVARALLFTLGLEAKTHEGVNHLINMHFVKKEKLDPVFGKLFSRVMKYREQADYDPASVFTRSDVEEELVLVRDFESQVRDYLTNEGFLK